MKNTLFAIALAAVGFAAVPNLSHAADTSGFFINGAVGRSNFSSGPFDDDDTGYLGNVGYRWAVAPNVLLGVEGGYTKLGDFDSKSSFGDRSKAELEGWNLGVNGHFNVTDNWYVSGRGGWFRGDTTLKQVGFRSVDDTKDGWYAGAGFGYDFNSNMSVGLNYDYYRVKNHCVKFDPDLVSVSGEYRF